MPNAHFYAYVIGNKFQAMQLNLTTPLKTDFWIQVALGFSIIWWNLVNYGSIHQIIFPIKCDLKLLIHSQTSMAVRLKFGNGWLISSHIKLMWLFIHTAIRLVAQPFVQVQIKENTKASWRNHEFVIPSCMLSVQRYSIIFPGRVEHFLLPDCGSNNFPGTLLIISTRHSRNHTASLTNTKMQIQ